jgi:hypothetical protein
MKKPDTLVAQYSFLVFVGILIFFIFSVIMWVLNLGGRCSSGSQPKKEEKKKRNNTIVYLLVFVLVCSMAAQAVNQSYRKIVPK